MGTMRNDFVVESQGNCFLCLGQTQTISEFSGSPVYSLQILSRYLNLSLIKVFKELDQAPSHLLARVERSKLKVELCKGCALLRDDFSRRYRQLERIQMEMASSLHLIHAKLCQDNDDTKTEDIVDHDWKEKLDVLKVLRVETLQKCARKLQNSSPIVKVHKLTSKTISKETAKLAASSSSSLTTKRNRSIKEEISNSDADNDYHLDNAEIEDDCDFTNGATSPTIVEDSKPNFQYPKGSDVGSCPQFQRPSTAHHKRQKRKETMSKNTFSFEEIRPPGLEKIDIPKCDYNKTTRKYKCPRCPSDFNCTGNFNIHFKNVHLQIKYKCGLCNKLFTQKAHCYAHHVSAHSGLRFSCHVCKKQLTSKSILADHLRRSTCGRGIAFRKLPRTCHCPQCGKGFTHRTRLEIHQKQVHSRQPRVWKCNQCKTTFTRKYHLTRHMVNIHRHIKGAQI